MYTLVEFAIAVGHPVAGYWIEVPSEDFNTAVALAGAMTIGYRLGSGLPATVQSVQRAKPRHQTIWNYDMLAGKLAELRKQ